MYRGDERMHEDASGRSGPGRSGQSGGGDPPPDEEGYYARSQSHPPYGSPSSRRDSMGSGGRKKFKYEKNEEFDISLTGASIATKRTGNVQNPGRVVGYHHHQQKSFEDDRTVPGSATIVTASGTEKTSSISSSSTGSRRRRQERERQPRGRVSDMDGSENMDRITPIMEVGGINFVQEFQGKPPPAPVGGGGGTTTASQQPADYSRTPSRGEPSRGDHLRGERSRGDYTRSDFSRGDYYSRGEHSRVVRNNSSGTPSASNKKNNQMDWPSDPLDHFMQAERVSVATVATASTQQSGCGGGGGGGGGIDDVQSAQSQIHHQVTQQQQAQQAGQPQGGRRAVLHACDNKGRCLFHPHIILRKKVLLGVMGGWKDVLPACPECELEDMGGGERGSAASGSTGGSFDLLTASMNVVAPQKGAVKFDHGVNDDLDKSWSSRPRSSRRSSVDEGEGVEEEEEEGEEEESSSNDDGDSSSGDSSSSEGSSEGSSGGASSSSSEGEEEGEDDGHRGLRQREAGVGRGDHFPPRPVPRGRGGGGGGKPSRRINMMAGGAGSKVKKGFVSRSREREDFISSYISSGVPSRLGSESGQKGKQKSLHSPMVKTARSHREQPSPPSLSLVRRGLSDGAKHSELLTPNDSMELSIGTPQQGGKKMFKGVSKGVSKGVTGLIKKSRKKLTKSVRATMQLRSSEGDNDGYNYSDGSSEHDVGYDDDMYGRSYFSGHDPPVAVGEPQAERHSRPKRGRGREEGRHRQGELTPTSGVGDPAQSRHRPRGGGGQGRSYHGQHPNYRRARDRDRRRDWDPQHDWDRDRDRGQHRPRGVDRKYPRGESLVADGGRVVRNMAPFTAAGHRAATIEKKKVELEKKLSAELVNNKGGHSQNIAGLQARLEDMEKALSSLMNERAQGDNTVAGESLGSRDSRGSRKSSMDSGSSTASPTQHHHPGAVSKDSIDVEDDAGYVGGVLDNSDVAYQWDRVPLPELPLADDQSAEELSAPDPSDPEQSASEEDSHDQRLADVAYQWDRVPLPLETSKKTDNNDNDNPCLVKEVLDYTRVDHRMRGAAHHGDCEERLRHHEQTSNSDPNAVLDMEEEEIDARLPLSGSTNSLESSDKLQASERSDQMGLLSMDDLLHSIQEEITASSDQLDRTPFGGGGSVNSRGNNNGGSFHSHSENNKEPSSLPQLKTSRGSSSSQSRDNSTSVPQLESSLTSSFYEDSGQDYTTRRGYDEPIKPSERNLSTTPLLSSEDSKSEEVQREEEEGVTSQQDEPDADHVVTDPPAISDVPKPLPLIGNYGGLKIDLSALQAFKTVKKPEKKDSRATASSSSGGGLNIDLNSLQASKPINHEIKAGETPEISGREGLRGQQQSSREEKKLIKDDVKTFQTTNLPFTGQFGESGMYTGYVNQQYEPHGRGTMVYDNGKITKGYWDWGDFVRESGMYSDVSDEDGNDEDGEGEEEDLTSSMANVGLSSRDRSRSRSRSRSTDRHAAAPPQPPPPPKQKTLSPPPPEYKVGDPGKHRDMILDKEESLVIIEQLKFGDGAFIRRSDGKWTYAIVKSLEETEEGKSAIRFTVNDRNSSKSYAKKYWGTHVRPLKGTKIKPSPEKEPDKGSSAGEREGRAKQREEPVAEEIGRGRSCPPTQSRLTFGWGTGRQQVQHGRSRSRSRRRAVSFSPMRQLTSIAESDVEDDEEEEDDAPS